MNNKFLVTMMLTSVISVQGCAVTSEIDGEEAVAFAGGQLVTNEHKLYQGINIGSMEGFSGTNMLAITGNVSPDLTNEGVSYALKKTLGNVGMLAQEGAGQYILNVTFLENNEEGA